MISSFPLHTSHTNSLLQSDGGEQLRASQCWLLLRRTGRSQKQQDRWRPGSQRMWNHLHLQRQAYLTTTNPGQIGIDPYTEATLHRSYFPMQHAQLSTKNYLLKGKKKAQLGKTKQTQNLGSGLTQYDGFSDQEFKITLNNSLSDLVEKASNLSVQMGKGSRYMDNQSQEEKLEIKTSQQRWRIPAMGSWLTGCDYEKCH